jgi:hypothetical protein
MDVEHILMTKDANLNSALKARDPSLETDDAHTRQSLRVPAAAMSFMSDRIKVDDVVRKFTESSSSSRRSSFQRPSTQNVPALDENRRPRWSESQVGVKLPEPRTPNVPRTRMDSTSSAETFPLKGTRASVTKKLRQEQEKHTPYKPPEGTRAAQLRSRS